MTMDIALHCIALHCTVMCPNQQKAEISPDALTPDGLRSSVQCWILDDGHKLDTISNRKPALTHRNKSFFDRSFQMKLFSNGQRHFYISDTRISGLDWILRLFAYRLLSGSPASTGLLYAPFWLVGIKRLRWNGTTEPFSSLARLLIHSFTLSSFYPIIFSTLTELHSFSQ
jgi:hypothetical protein